MIIDTLNALAALWAGVMLRGLIEATAVLLVVTSLWLMFRRRMSSQLSYGLFLLVLLKLVVPASVTVPAGWLRYSPVVNLAGPWTGNSDIHGKTDPWGLRRVRSEKDIVGPHATTTESASENSASPAQTPNPLSLQAWLMIGWTVIVTGLLMNLINCQASMRRRLKDARPLESGDLPIDFAVLVRQAGLRGSIRILEVPWIASPAVWGLFRPAVLVPPKMDQFLSVKEMTWVLLHELIHIRRRDNWVSLFQRLMQILYFFHPAVWLANRMIDATREFSCDDAAVVIANLPRRECGRGFLAVVERAMVSPWPSDPILGLIRSKTLIRSRLMRILDDRRPLHASLHRGSMIVWLAVAAIALPRVFAQVETPAKPNEVVAFNGQEPSPSTTDIAQVPVRGTEEKASTAPTSHLAGVVRDQNGKPVAEVAITGTQIRHEIDFDNGVLRDVDRRDRPFVTTDANGRYDFGQQTTELGAFAYHERGYARKSASELATSSDLVLQPWGRVEGQVTILGKPLPNVPIRFMLDATDNHSMFYEVYEYDAKTDDQGRFTVEHVPAGVASACTGTRFGKDAGPFGVVSSANQRIKPGETLHLNIGGDGRPVIGRLHIKAGIPINLGGGRLVSTATTSPKAPEPSAEEMETWDRDQIFRHHFDAYRSPAGLARRLQERYFGIRINADGTFRAVEVVPGKYTMEFWIGDDFKHPIVIREVVVPDHNQPLSEPLDVGTIEITPPN